MFLGGFFERVVVGALTIAESTIHGERVQLALEARLPV